MIADDLAKYTYNLKYSDLSDDVIHEVKRRFVDSLGCAIGAKDAEPVKIVKKTVAADRMTLNAFVYSTMIRYLDYNDTYLSKEPAHPSDNIGTVLAATELIDSIGKDAILSTALAYEIQCRFCDAASLRKRGWDHVIYGLISAGMAAGKIMRLNQKQLTQTINLSLASNLSSRQVREGAELSMWKASAFGHVARNAIFAAKLAKGGMTGPNEIFEGKYGLANQVLGGSLKIDIKKFGKRKSRFRILDCWSKKWSAEIHSQSAIQAALELRDQVKLSDISKIEIETHEAGYTIIGSGKEKWTPNTKETADHSLPYITGAALMDGNVNPDTFKPKRYRDKKLLALVKKITVKENKKLTKLYPKSAANLVRIKLKSGKKIESKVIYQRGHSKNKMSDKELEEKFKTLTENFISSPQQRKILNYCWNLEKMRSIKPLVRFLK